MALLMALRTIAKAGSFEKAVRQEAKDLLDSLYKFENILISLIFLRIFKATTPISLYLQTKDLEMLQALSMLKSGESQLQKVSRDFDSVHKIAIEFCISLNELLHETDIEMEMKLLITHWIPNPVYHFRINIHNAIMDCILENMKRRFTDLKGLYKDYSC